MRNLIKSYIKNEDALVTIEWVGISAVVFIAAVVITTFMLQSASGLGDAVADKMDASATEIAGDQQGG